jgi:ribosomal protein L11 methyltransferase
MSWVQLQLCTDPDSAKALEALMEEAGALSVTMVDAADQPLFEPGPGETPLWNDILLTGLFMEGTDSKTVIAQLQENFQNETLPSISTVILKDKNWHRAWMDEFKPTLFGERLWICPSWTEVPDPQAVNIMLDPGLAFGTGTHPTTSLCLKWLDGQDIKNQTIIDYGCGSGILGIGALLLGATLVYGVDNDPQALIATKDNCEKNSISLNKFPTYLPETFAREITARHIHQADGVLANILAGPLVELAEYLSALVKPNGWLLLSGILEEQADSIVERYQPWFDNLTPVSEDGWVRIEGIRKETHLSSPE